MNGSVNKPEDTSETDLALLQAKSRVLRSLLLVINQDKDDDYIICKEAKDIIQEAYSLYTQEDSHDKSEH